MTKKTNLVVKTNWLNTALQTLTKVEIRIIQLAIVDARETGTGLSTDTPLTLSATRYSELFGGTREVAYDNMKRAEKSLFERRFTFVREGSDKPTKSRWLQEVTYLDGEGTIELVFTKAVVEGISRIDGLEEFFTSYLLEKTVDLNSIYAIRLYELIIQWRKTRKTPVFEINKFRDQLGVGINEYKTMSNFKARVLDKAVKEINEHTDIEVKYKNVKKGVKIVGFSFTFKIKETKDDTPKPNSNSTSNSIKGLSDPQIGRITRSPLFIKDYASRVSPNSPINKDMTAWSAHFVQELKKDASKFSKRPIRDYLDY